MKNKNNYFVITIVSNIISVIVSLLISFFISKYIISVTGKEAYSFYPIAVNFTAYFSSIYLIINSVSSRFIMIPYINKYYKESNDYCSTVFFSNVFLSIIICIIEIVFYIYLEKIINIPLELLKDVKKLFLFIFATSLINGLTSFFTTGYYVKERMDCRAYSVIIENVSKGAIALFLLCTKKITIANFGETIFISSIIRSIFDIVCYKRLMKDLTINWSSFSFANLREILKYGIWSLLSQSGILLINNIQLIISNIYLGVNYSSELALVQPLITVCSLLNTTVSQFIDPTITKNISKKIKESNYNINNLYTIIEIFAIIPIILVLSYSNHFFKLWIPNEYNKKLYILTILSCIELLITATSIIYESILITLFKLKEKAIAYLLSGFLNIIILSIFLTQTSLENFGILSSTIITYIIFYLIFIPTYAKRSLKKINLQINYLSIRDCVLYSILVISNILISINIFINGYISLFVICIINYLLDLIILAVFKKINLKKFFSFLKTQEFNR